ncbi:MAG: amidohydrolase family protein [Chloroflexi bacterium]|nr:amidohydrolase family protein [Chloroflexota bacterium]
MIFDFRVFLGESFDGTRQTADELLKRMDSLEIDKALACPFKPLSYNLDQANASLAAAVKARPDRLFGAARVDPWQPTAGDSLRRALDTLGVRALYLNPWEETFQCDLKILDPLMAIALERRVPLLIASGYPWMSEALQVLELASRWPKVQIVMSNGGQINITGLGQADATLALRHAQNLYVDTAGVYRQDFIEETVGEFGGERVLFGSGAPYFDQRYEIKRVQLAKVEESARLLMQADNALRLLGLGK